MTTARSRFILQAADVRDEFQRRLIPYTGVFCHCLLVVDNLAIEFTKNDGVDVGFIKSLGVYAALPLEIDPYRCLQNAHKLRHTVFSPRGKNCVWFCKQIIEMPHLKARTPMELYDEIKRLTQPVEDTGATIH